MNDGVWTLQRLALELIAAKRPPDEILDRLCELVQEIVPNGIASVMRLDAARNELTFRNAPSAPACVLEAFGVLTPGPLSGSCGSSVHARKMVAVEDTSTDPRWETLRAVAKVYEIRSCWSVPIFLDEDRIGGTFAISRSITGTPKDDERQLLELAAYLAGIVLRIEETEARADEQNARLRAIVECSEDPIFVKDRDGRYQLVNEAEAKHRGVAASELIGKTDLEIYENESISAALAADRKVLETGRSIVHELEVRSVVDDERREYLIRKDPLRDASGEIVGIVGIARDLTETRRVERAMQQAQKLESLGILAGGIAHDFNNMLVGVLANASVLESATSLGDDERRCIGAIRRASERAADLTTRMLQYAGKRAPERRTIAMEELVDEIPVLLSTAVSSRVSLCTEIEPGLPAISADPVQMRQVLMNLTLNASEACGDSGGEVVLRAQLRRDCMPEIETVADTERRDWMLIEVSDNGCGVDRETLGRMFDPFFTTKATGRGLGLAAVLGIVGSHGGHLDVDSTLGQGTTFRIWLPAEATGVVTNDDVEPPSVRKQSGRILVVEDEAMVTDVLARILHHHGGYDVDGAEDGLKGLEAFEAAPDDSFCTIIVDCTMPSMDGRQLIARIRQQDSRVPIVMTSGLPEADARAGCSDDHIDAFLSKPFSSHDVMTAVEAARERRAARTNGSG